MTRERTLEPLDASQQLVNDAMGLYNDHVAFLERLSAGTLEVGEVKLEMRTNEQLLDHLFHTMPKANAALERAGYDAPKFSAAWSHLATQRKSGVVIDPSLGAKAAATLLGGGAEHAVRTPDISAELREAIVALRDALPVSHRVSPDDAFAYKRNAHTRVQAGTRRAALFGGAALVALVASFFIGDAGLSLRYLAVPVLVFFGARAAYRTYRLDQGEQRQLRWTSAA